MSLIVFAIVVILVIGLLVYGESMLPIDARFVQLIQALTVILGAVVIANRAGLV